MLFQRSLPFSQWERDAVEIVVMLSLHVLLCQPAELDFDAVHPF